jgi:flagellar protein FliL
MSSEAAAPADAAPPGKGKKKLILIIAAAVVLAGGGGGAFVYMKKKAAAEAAAAAEEDGEQAPAKKAEHKPAHGKDAVPPTFVALDPFTVNLADREAERYAQIGMTLEVDDAKFADQMKAYMPAIRNNILMVLAHKTAGELLQREGKQMLAEEVAREAVRPMGIEIESDDEDEAAESKKKKKKKRRAPAHNPVRQVHFSNFIIQ